MGRFAGCDPSMIPRSHELVGTEEDANANADVSVAHRMTEVRSPELGNVFRPSRVMPPKADVLSGNGLD
jgi:hypothetical protein